METSDYLNELTRKSQNCDANPEIYVVVALYEYCPDQFSSISSSLIGAADTNSQGNILD